MSAASSRVLVAGGGIAGLAAALALRKAGLDVDVLDARPADAAGAGRDGRTTAILLPGVRLLERLGVWSHVAPATAPLARLRIVSLSPDGRTEADVVFAARELGERCFGWNVLNGDLHAAMLAVARRAGIGVEPGVRVTSLETRSDRVGLGAADGRSFEGALVVGADGRDSSVRELSGIEAERDPTGQTAIVTRFAHARPHHGTSIELHRPGGPFTLVPMPGRGSSLVWVERDAEAARLMGLAADGFAAELGTRVAPWLGAVSDVAPPAAFGVENLRARRLVAPRIVLTGEAAHALSPLGAQGFNLSLRDAETLGALAAEAVAAGTDLGSMELLERYERARATDIRVRVLGIAGLGRLVDTDLTPLRLARGLGLRAVGAVAPLRRAVMQGLMTPVPPLPLARLAPAR